MWLRADPDAGWWPVVELRVCSERVPGLGGNVVAVCVYQAMWDQMVAWLLPHACKVRLSEEELSKTYGQGFKMLYKGRPPVA